MSLAGEVVERAGREPRWWHGLTRWSSRAALLAVLSVAALRVLGAAQWRGALVVAAGALGVRVVLVSVDAARGRVPWTRVLLPSIIAIEMLAFEGSALARVRVATAIALEVMFLIVALRAVLRCRGDGEPAEQRIGDALTTLLPAAVARIAAIEIVVLAMSVRFLCGGWRRPTPAGFSYHRESGLRLLLPALPLLGIGDVLLLEIVVLPHATPWLRVGAHVLALYGLVWLVGVYASMRERPHTVERTSGRLVLHRGVLRRLAIDVDDLVSIAPLPSFADGWKKRDYLRGTLRLDLGATHALEHRLRDGRRVIVGVDDPGAFVGAVTALAGRQLGPTMVSSSVLGRSV